MTEPQDLRAEPAIVQALMGATLEDQRLLLEWSRALTAIRLSERTGGQKITAALTLTRERKALWPLLKLMGRALKVIVWDARSWKLRLGLGTLIGTFMVLGNGAAAIVHLGAGLGLPLWVLLGIGGTLAGALADLLTGIAQRPGR